MKKINLFVVITLFGFLILPGRFLSGELGSYANEYGFADNAGYQRATESQIFVCFSFKW